MTVIDAWSLPRGAVGWVQCVIVVFPDQTHFKTAMIRGLLNYTCIHQPDCLIVLQDYCYTAQCDHEGCLTELIEFMNTKEHGSFCKAGDNGCQVN